MFIGNYNAGPHPTLLDVSPSESHLDSARMVGESIET